MASMRGARSALRGLRSFSFPSSSTNTNTSSFSFSRVSRPKPPTSFSRLPVELGSAHSLMPLHSATASALLTSKLSHKPGTWAWLSEDA